MKLKPVVASLFALGLASAPVLAVAHTAQQAQANADMAKLESIIAQNNANAGMSYLHWLKRIHFSGMINVDGKYTNRGPLAIAPVFQGKNGYASDINVNNANLFVDADVNKYVKAHVGLAYVADSVNNASFIDNQANRQDKTSVFSGSRMTVDEAYVTISDLQQYPFFARAGKMYTPFGSYSNPYPISYSLTQLLTQTRATTAEVGYVNHVGAGVMNASLFTFSGGQSSQRSTDGQTYTALDNYGAKVGYAGNAYDMAYSVNASYIKDIRDADFLNDVAMSESSYNNNANLNWRHAGAVSANARLAFDNYPVVLTGSYVSALRGIVAGADSRIWAADFGGNYGFKTLNHNSNVGLSYQSSGEAAGLLPKWRVQGDYAVSLMKNTTLTMLLQHNADYSDSQAIAYYNGQGPQTATGKSNNLIAARLGVKF